MQLPMELHLERARVRSSSRSDQTGATAGPWQAAVVVTAVVAVAAVVEAAWWHGHDRHRVVAW